MVDFNVALPARRTFFFSIMDLNTGYSPLPTGDTSVANALFHVCVGIGDYTLHLDHFVLVWSDICHLGCDGDMWDYVWRT